MPRKRKAGKHYFTKDHENAIIDYVATDDQKIRTQLYIDWIGPAFDEMVDKIVYTYKFTTLPNIDALKDECKVWLTTILDKYDPSKGSKAFSYFSIVAKNYLILHNNNNYKKMKTHDKIDVMDWDRSIQTEISQKDTDSSYKEFVSQMLEYWDNNMNVIFRRQKDIRVADAVLHIFRIKGSIELFNKKALYILIREMTQSNTQHITRVINVMKKYQKGIYKEFQVNGFIDTKTTGSFVIHN